MVHLFGNKEAEFKKHLDELHADILKYYPDVDFTKIDKAYHFAATKHEGQLRKSGDPYYMHPLEVTRTLTKLRMDVPSLIAALLHDVVEDTEASLEDIEKEFGQEVRILVDGVTKLSKFNFKSTEEAQAENFRKMVIAMAKDIRVIIIKLADRLHNMRTLNHLTEEKQKRIAQETIDIYAPIANRLGIAWLKTELEDTSFMYLEPDTYMDLVNKVQKQKTEKEKYIQEVLKIIEERLAEFQIKARVSGRLKNYYSIANKMKDRSLEFEQIYDLIAFRIIVDDVSHCYEILGIIHSFWKPVPGRFKDYIAMPKPNNYQSLHTTVIGPYGERVEIQIRTIEMHRIAEYGIAAHWLYKEGHMANDDTDKFTWLRSLLENQDELSDPTEFLDSMKMDLFSGEVYVFTPKGDVRALPMGSTPIDFAYAVHTDVGHRCTGAKVNDLLVPLKHELNSGDTVEIITSKTQAPKKDWLKYVKTARAKIKIRQYLKTIEKERSKELGYELLEKEFKKYHLSYQNMNKEGKISEAAAILKYKNIEELVTAIGYGHVTPRDVIKIIVPEPTQQEKGERPSIFEEIVQRAARSVRSGRNAVKVKGVEDVLVRFAKCCTPIHGEPIIGFITRGRGITIHRRDCTKVLEIDSDRIIEVEWEKEVSGERITRIKIEVSDTPGLLAKMSKTFAEAGANVVAVDIKTTDNQRALCYFDAAIGDVTQLNKILSNLKKIHGIFEVSRIGIVEK
ncbi:MAG: bifunctional (p)ppGpp synthetase/guanosine-3',5'-bis(diphosphate) 3'-pyrophosphohydrolase [bacterium]